MAIEGTRGLRRLRNSIPLPFVHIFTAIGLLSYHVNAEFTTIDNGERSFLERLSLGPEYFTTMDKVLFAVVILLGLELINLLAGNSGCKTVLQLVIFLDHASLTFV